MSELDRLVELQGLDTRLDQLRYKGEHLPARSELEELHREVERLSGQRDEVAGARSELSAQQKRIEDEVALLDDKIGRENDRMYSGTITSPKELSAIQDELESLGRRKDHLEEKILDLMEAIEPVTSQVAEMETRLADIRAEAGRLEARVTTEQAEIDAEAAQVDSNRAALAAEIPPDLLSRYTKARAGRRDGVAVARLIGSTCGACGLSLPTMFVEQVRHSSGEELFQCEECGVLLAP
ncbi:MAG TPA: hypothetical protein ENI86_12710 [Acidimicrobiales bacterium]|nr:hypothetical protein [Acidimicrobiales bacterium]